MVDSVGRWASKAKEARWSSCGNSTWKRVFGVYHCRIQTGQEMLLVIFWLLYELALRREVGTSGFLTSRRPQLRLELGLLM